MDDAWIRSDFKEVDKRDDLGKVLGWLLGRSRDRPIITDGKQPYAILHTRALMSRKSRSSTRIDKVAQPVPCIEAGEGIEVITRRFAESLAPYLPVRDPVRGTTQGYIDALTALEAAFEQGPAAHEAFHEAPTLRANDPIELATRAFSETSSDHIAVLDDDGRIKGSLPRSAVVQVMEYEDQPQGRKDFGGESIDVRHRDPVGSWMEGRWAENLPDDGFEEIVENLRAFPATYAVDRDGRYQGILSAAYVIRRAREITGPPQPGRSVAPHFRQA